jgi:hypothetical protein
MALLVSAWTKDGAVHGLQQGQVLLQRRDLVVGRLDQQVAAVPAADQGQVIAIEQAASAPPGRGGKTPPSSTPVKPIAWQSANTLSSGVSPPSSGMSSLIQAMGLTPKRMVMGV